MTSISYRDPIFAAIAKDTVGRIRYEYRFMFVEVSSVWMVQIVSWTYADDMQRAPE